AEFQRQAYAAHALSLMGQAAVAAVPDMIALLGATRFTTARGSTSSGRSAASLRALPRPKRPLMR
ncbi:MAG TPA: hypothetical protein VFE78_04185, partial [Gemmataceae bacterium]|nr:hypothetical protein [Gemmataceae bacterium]